MNFVKVLKTSFFIEHPLVDASGDGGGKLALLYHCQTKEREHQLLWNQWTLGLN